MSGTNNLYSLARDKDAKAYRLEFDHSLRKIEFEKNIIWDLFPYKIKNRDLFYQRNHPKQLNPESLRYSDYWDKFEKKCIEGEWINDEGTWVFMMPKLFYYINCVTIIGNVSGDETKRREIQPDLSSLEWILSSYGMLIDGFSGFEDDDEYTCNNLVYTLSKGIDLDEYDVKKLDKGCYNNKGELKVYVDPWEYLTRFYLVDNHRGNLGSALYYNSKQDRWIVTGKLYSCRYDINFC